MIKRFLPVFLVSALVLTSASIAALATDTTETVPTATPEAVVEPTATPDIITEAVVDPTATPEIIIEYVYLEQDAPAIWDKPFDDYTPAEGLLLLIFAGGFFAALVSVVFYKVI